MPKVSAPVGSVTTESNGEVATFLRNARLKKNISQGEVAERLGFKSPQYLSNIERGVATPPAHIMQPMAKMYGFKVEKLAELMVARYERSLFDAIRSPKRYSARKKVVEKKKATK